MTTHKAMPHFLASPSFQRCLFTCLALSASALISQGQQQEPAAAIYAQSELTSKHLITGEQTYLKISIQNASQGFRPSAPQIPNTAVNFASNRVEIDSRRRITRSFVYRIRPAKPGIYTVPPVSATGRAGQYSGQALSFEVRDPNELSKVPSGIPGQDILIGWFPAKTKLYAGEQCPLTLKIYVPTQLRPTSWGLPESEKDNCLAWRFSAPTRDNLGEVFINKASYISAPFKTTLSGISPGKATFGPTRLSIVSRTRTIDPRRGIRISDVPLSISLPAIDFDILPLPPGAPAGFKGAIGKFNIAAESKKASIKDTDTVEVLLQVQGEGNLENIQAPQLTGKGWKIIDSSKITRGGERRLAQGAVTFRQILRPESSASSAASSKLPSTIPPYSLSFFNPDNQSYYTLTTAPIPISVTRTLDASQVAENAASSPIQSAAQRPEDMRDILGFIQHATSPRSQDAGSMLNKLRQLLRSYWQLIPALICLIIISIPIRKKIKAYQQNPSSKHEQKKALKDIASASDTETFYRRAGRFIEQWLSPDDELNHILAERDQHCFSSDGPQQDLKQISAQSRQEITESLKRHAKRNMMLLLACISCVTTITISPTKASQEALQGDTGPLPSGTQLSTKSTAQTALDKGHYQKAINLYLEDYPSPSQTPADILYNIGNCHYLLDQPGLAALAWRRALVQQSDHLQARKNLRYLELKEGASTPEVEHWQQQLTTLPLNLYQNLYRASLWILLIAMLLLRLFRPQRATALLILIFLMPITAILAAIGCYFYPDTEVHTPYTQQAVCLTKTSLYPEAQRQIQPLMTLAPSSLVTVNSSRGSWLYVTTTDDQSGWVRDRSISPVVQGD